MILGRSCPACEREAISAKLTTTELPRGAMVQRLARGPFKAEIRVRFPLALPRFNNYKQIHPDSR